MKCSRLFFKQKRTALFSTASGNIDEKPHPTECRRFVHDLSEEREFRAFFLLQRIAATHGATHGQTWKQG